MPGVDPYGSMRDVAGRLDSAGAIDPELQGLADNLMERLRSRLTELQG